jgi:peptide/nickel transport system substrate-binding protein
MRRTQHLLAGFGIIGLTMLAGGSLSYFEEAQPSTLNPLYAKSMPEKRTAELVFDRMFYRSAITNEIKSHIILDDGKMGTGVKRLGDGKSVTITLKKGIKWHDGKPLTGKDICFTVDAMLNPRNPTERGKDFRETIASCVVPAKDQATVTFNKVYHNPRARLDFSLLPAHKFKSTTITIDDEFATAPTGTGPMKATLGRRGTRLESVANVHHLPKLAGMQQSEGGDPLVQVRTITQGGVQGLISVSPALRSEVAASTDVALKSYDLRSWWFIAINTNKSEALRNQQVRTALNMSLDREQLRELTIGVDKDDPNPPCEFISGPFVGSSPYYNRAVKVESSASRPLAKTLMTAAGASDSAGRWMWKGAPISLKIGMQGKLNNEATDLLNQIGNQLQQSGFDRQVYRVNESDWNRKAVTGQMSSEYDLLIGKWSFGLVEDVNSLFHTRTGGQGTLNIFNYSNPKVDGLLGDYDKARTDTEAKDAYHNLHAYLAQDLPYLFLWKLDTKSAWRNEVKNIIISPYYYFTEFDGWRI